jgi:hypothetical protein
MRKVIEENGKFYYEDNGVINYDNEIKEIKVCGCDDEHQVPLIWTFAFNGAEYWCPFCGNNYGMMGAGEAVPITKEIFERGEKYKEFSKEFLDAKSTTICESLMFEGKRISPEELPNKEKERMLKVINDWKYDVKL